jgi:rare lipoprotein A
MKKKSFLGLGLLLAVITIFGIAQAKTEIYFGIASYYHSSLEGNRTACGQIFRQRKLTAAHKTLPCGTKVRVTRIKNGRTVDVIINDRGPFVKGRIIDLSLAAANKLRMKKSGIAKVSMEILKYGDGKYRKE